MTASFRPPVGGRGRTAGIALGERIALGRVAGIRVGANWSVLAVFGLVSWGLAGIVFPRQAPGLEPVAYWGTAVGTAVLLFGSLLAHEFGHALLARREGIGIEGITLWSFGGVTKLTGRADNPGTELRIAMAGPLSSMAVAATAALLAEAAAAIGLPRLVAAALAWLANINVLLAACNLLIPAMPLDGGWILRAVLWGRTGDGPRAAMTTARVGRLAGCLLIGVGLAELALRANLGGLWVALLGWFLLGVARAEERTARLRRRHSR